MPIIDVTNYIEEQGVRKVRFGGLEPEDVRRALQTLSAEYEKHLTGLQEELRRLRQENDALQAHCQKVTAQNSTLSSQNAALAGSSERYSRRQDEMDGQLSSLRGRNHSLNDQVALLRMQNDDLRRDNAVLQDRVEQAEATLRHKGAALDRERDDLNTRRGELLEQARTEADKLRADAQGEADKTLENARAQARDIELTACEQGRAQARRVVEAATAEANEIQNAHQLRLNDLRGQVQALEKRLDQLSAYLRQVGSELLETDTRLRTQAPPADIDPAPAAAPLEWKAVEVPELELDLSPETVAHTARRLAQTPAAPAGGDAENPPEPSAGQTEAPHRDFTLVVEPGPTPPPSPPAPQPGPVEIPGAIFSYPIRRSEDEPIPDDDPPVPGPRQPVMPVLPAEEDEPLPADRLPIAQRGAKPRIPVPPPPSVLADREKRRRKAVCAVRALQRMCDRG